jgi:hypothetical protein
MSPGRERLLRLVALLPEEAIPEAAHALGRFVRDPLARALADEVDHHEPLTPEVHPALEQARKEVGLHAGRRAPVREESPLA